MQKTTVKIEHPYCSKLNQNIEVKQNYIELSGKIITKGHLSCEFAFQCQSTTNCKHAGHSEFGVEYLR
jgi:hypothetical protein